MFDRDRHWGLPDPEMQAEFYTDVPVKRGIAWVVDILLIALLTWVIVLFTAFVGLFFIGFIFFSVGVIYRTVSLANASATPGMRLVAIELRTGRGEHFDLGHAALHTAGYYVSMGAFPLQIVSIILMLTGARGQGLTDLVLGSAAVNRNARW
jgi:uncharacterized RDD family membrane protein YckC